VLLSTLLCFFGLTLSFGADDKPDEKIRECEYYPFAIGTTWKATGILFQKVTHRVVKYEKVGDELCAVVEHAINGKVRGSEHLVVRDDGLYRLKAFGDPLDGPLRMLKLPPKKDDTWEDRLKINKQEFIVTHTLSEDKVKVPAGEYDAVMVEIVATNADTKAVFYRSKSWFVKGIGIVKTQLENVVFSELDKFEKAK
jgi:hypothetical protein